MDPNLDHHDPSEREPAPAAELHLLQDFVNTNDLERGRDAIGTPEQLLGWLAERGLVADGSALDVGLHRRALAIREGVRALARANSGEPPDAEAVEDMNRAAARLPVVIGVQLDDWLLRPAGAGVEAFLARLMAAVVRSMADDSWSRVKACRNDTCRWLFFDQSRNRSGTWCTMAICGSRIKARAYRARQREAAQA
ncbi:MAG: CGNR zinc finger domain-containing protein [Candidatus Limnocylindria bacterium]